MTPQTATSDQTLSGNPHEAETLRIKVPRVFKPLLRRGPKYKGARGGRGSGKSHFFGEQVIVRCLEDPTTRVVCVREVQNSLSESSKRLITDKIESMGVGYAFEVLDNVIHVLDDDGVRRGIIIFVGMQNHTAKSIKSLEGFNIAWVEEAQSLSQRSLDLLTPTIREAGGEIWFSWNSEKASDPVETFMCHDEAQADPDIICVTANYHDNPWFAETSLVADMERDKRRDPEKYAHIWLGAYLKRSKASVFTNWKIRNFTTPAETPRFYYGADWGFSVDPSVLIRCFVGRLEGTVDNPVAVPDPKGTCLFVDREAYKVGCEIDETPALFAGDCPPQFKQENGLPRWTNPHRHTGIPGALKWPITADSARPETISYMARQGFSIHPAKKGPGSVEDGIEFLKDYDIVVHPDCVYTIDELSLYSYKIDPKTDEVLPILEDKKNHVIDSLRYAVEAVRRARVMNIRNSVLQRA